MGFNVGGFLGSLGTAVSSIFGKTPQGAVIGAGLQVAGSALTPRGSPPGRATTPPPGVPSQPQSSQTSPIQPQQISRGFQPAIFRGSGERFGAPSANVASLAPTALSRGASALGGLAIGEGISRMFGGSSNKVSEILREARENTGGSVTKNKIIDAAKFCGIDNAASTFGISTEEVCLVIVAGRTRRNRGISAADIRKTKRVIRFNKRLTKDLKVK